MCIKSQWGELSDATTKEPFQAEIPMFAEHVATKRHVHNAFIAFFA